MKNITHTKLQWDIHNALWIQDKRYVVACASRGHGKSLSAAMNVVQAYSELASNTDHTESKNRVIVICGSGTKNVVQTYCSTLLDELGLRAYLKKDRSYDGVLEMNGNIQILFVGQTAIERLRGLGIYFAVLDEVVAWNAKPLLDEAWDSIIEPAIRTRWHIHGKGKALIISTPKGKDTFYDMFVREQYDDNYKSFHADYRSAEHMLDADIEQAKQNIDPMRFKREYLATFTDTGNNVFHQYNPKVHVLRNIPSVRPNETIHVGIDFNINIMSAVAMVERGGELYIIGEIQGSRDTYELAESLINKYPDNTILAYPDPTGRFSKTSSKTNDFAILEEYGIKCYARKSTKDKRAGIDATNRLLCDADGNNKLFISHRCRSLLRTMAVLAWDDNRERFAQDE